MKKLYYALSLIGLTLIGCTNEMPYPDGAGSNYLPTANNFITVSVIPANGGMTRAEPAPGEYGDGNASEARVNSVRFFFFNEDGYAFPVWENRSTETETPTTYNSYVDWRPASTDSIPGDYSDQTVETVLHTTLGLTLPNEKPYSVLAVINPTSQILALQPESQYQAGTSSITVYGPSLEDLNENVADYLTNLHDYNFVMSNSVYVVTDGSTNSKFVATPIPEDSFTTDPTIHNDNDLSIYVERVLARLDLALGYQMGTGKPITPDNGEKFTIYPTKPVENSTQPDAQAETASGGYMVDGEPMDIYVRFLGWNVTGTSNQSRLIKEVNVDWTNAELFDSNELWNTSDYHRSFWALNPDELTYQFGAFEETAADDGDDDDPMNIRRRLPENESFSDYYEFDETANTNPAQLLEIVANTGEANTRYVTTYLQENANAYSSTMEAAGPGYPTKVIIAAQLCDEDGTPLSLAEWNYRKYEVNNFINDILANELNQLWSGVNANGSTTYDEITADDIEFKTAQQLGIVNDDADYFVYLVLSETGEGKTWYLQGLDGEWSQPMNAAEVDAYIYNKINRVRVWNEGYTYYYFDVKHLGSEGSPGALGIVRNHIYRSTITKVQGLGTPVYNPGQIIIPEENVYDESIINADIRVLQWRIISNDYEIVWK